MPPFNAMRRRQFYLELQTIQVMVFVLQTDAFAEVIEVGRSTIRKLATTSGFRCESRYTWFPNERFDGLGL